MKTFEILTSSAGKLSFRCVETDESYSAELVNGMILLERDLRDRQPFTTQEDAAAREFAANVLHGQTASAGGVIA